MAFILSNKKVENRKEHLEDAMIQCFLKGKLTHRDMAKLLDLTHQRVDQLLNYYDLKDTYNWIKLEIKRVKNKI